MAFFVGQKVVCIHRKWVTVKPSEIEAGIRVPEYGEVYTIRAIVQTDITGLLLRELKNPDFDYSDGFCETTWCATRFRPVTSIEVFKRMLVPNSKELCGND